MSTPLKIAFLWHQHQPYYKLNSEYILPWVRFHGIKDYLDIPQLLHEFPKIKQTINLVPSLLMQLDEYVDKKVTDKIYRLSQIRASELTESDKIDILGSFFICNQENLINPFPRFKELQERASDKNSALLNFSVQDWLDLQVLYNLTWLGQYSRREPSIYRLFIKGSLFTEYEKQHLLNFHLIILKNIFSELELLVALGQTDLSVSPFFHPILPLLIDSRSVHEALPNVELPEPPFAFPEDAALHIKRAKDYFLTRFSFYPSGMWPSEGSISDKSLELIAATGFKWIASDEDILYNTSNLGSLLKYFPHRFNTEKGNLTIFFRDHYLSDRIGFVYSNWNPNDASNDFCHYLENIRRDIINNWGEEALNYAVVPIILDGENCWEFYPDNGIHFLKSLYHNLSNNPLIETVLMSDVTKLADNPYCKPMNHIRAGSWINGDFSIWAGKPEDIAAWSMLSKVRNLFEEKKMEMDLSLKNEIMNLFLIAEGSDWFWWYGDEHWAPNKDDFDVMFRTHIRNIYKLLNIDPPDDTNYPIGRLITDEYIQKPRNQISPKINGKSSELNYWKGAGSLNLNAGMSSMHRTGELLSSAIFGFDDSYFYLKLSISRDICENESIDICFETTNNLILKILQNGIESQYQAIPKGLIFAKDECIDLAIPIIALKDNSLVNPLIKLKIYTNQKDSTFNYPSNEWYIL
ncbi:MAG: glycoside hydrolase family 57 protein [Candidatus Kapabacteria bacterium]|nr:glycoside hydrolase family 57 protein [Candidatus Kapabacteria bacterium]